MSAYVEPVQPPREVPKNRVLSPDERPRAASGGVEAKSSSAKAAVVDALLRSSPDGPVDSVLAATVIALIGFGVVMVYSASAIEATRMRDGELFLRRQAAFAGLGLVVMWIVSRIDYRRFKALTYPFLGVTLFLLGLTLTRVGHAAGNASRWIRLGIINIQPSEIAKVVLVMWLARSLAKKGERVKNFVDGLLPPALMLTLFGVLLIFQPDFGSTVMLAALTGSLLFVAGTRIRHLLAAGAVGAAIGVAAIAAKGYRMKRYLAWADLEGNRTGLAYQPFQSVMSFGSGGTTGLGLGRGLQVLYLPEAHTDFIAAIIGEELGFVGVCALSAAYLLVVARGVKIAFEAADDYGTYLAFGISTLFGLQALTNLAVAMSLLPAKGLTLPFLSYGGSSLLVNAAAVGALLSISRPRRPTDAPAAATEGSTP